jgi:hypothetical protein
MIFFGRPSLERALAEYTTHYHFERNHQGLRNRLVRRSASVDSHSGARVKRRQRLGGMLNYLSSGGCLVAARLSTEFLGITP